MTFTRSLACLMVGSAIVSTLVGCVAANGADIEEVGTAEQAIYFDADLGSITGTSIVQGNTCNQGNHFNPPCAFGSAADISYYWTAPTTGTYTFSTQGSSYDTALQILDQNQLATLGCNDDANGTSQSSAILSLTAGQKITINVDGYGSECGAFQLSIVPPAAAAKKAMTWALLGSATSGPNAYALVGSDATTNAYQGDTSTDSKLPLLCILKSNLPNPGTSVIGSPTQTPGGAWRRTWSGGTIALTAPIKGSSLTSRGVADSFCANQFGAGYRMAEFHDGDPNLWSGWDFWGSAKGANLSQFQGTRFWVAINDQNANPW